MRVNVLALIGAILGSLIGVLFLLSGAPLLGVGVLAASASGAAATARPLDLFGVAGGHVRSSARIAGIKVASIGLVELCVMGLLVTAAFDHWSRQGTVGAAAVYALAGLAVMLLVELHRQGDDLLNKLFGAAAEEQVEQLLEELAAEGWIVAHNLDRRWGNIDHVAISTSGAFAIETKSGPYRAKDSSQALGAAMELRTICGVGWVTAVVCTPKASAATKRGHTWVVGFDDLIPWLRQAQLHRGRPIDLEFAQRAIAAGPRRPAGSAEGGQTPSTAHAAPASRHDAQTTAR